MKRRAVLTALPGAAALPGIATLSGVTALAGCVSNPLADDGTATLASLSVDTLDPSEYEVTISVERDDESVLEETVQIEDAVDGHVRFDDELQIEGTEITVEAAVDGEETSATYTGDDGADRCHYVAILVEDGEPSPWSHATEPDDDGCPDEP